MKNNLLQTTKEKLEKRYLRPRFSFLQVQTLFIIGITAGMMAGLGILTNEVIIPKLFAATSPWTQTDWSGGVDSGLVTSTVTTYASETNIDPTTTAGEFSLDVKSGWYNSNWAYRKQITFDNTDSNLGVTSEDQINFQVLVKLDNGSDIDYSKTLDAGEDIRFTDSDGTTALDYEIEEWNESGTSYVWVQVPQIDSNSSSDSIYMYYGNSGASDGQNASAVWDNDYSMVYHFNEASGTTGADSVTDSTGNGAGTPSSGISFGQSGKISTTADFSSGTGINAGSIGSPTLTAPTTVSFWINTSSYSSPSRQNPFEQAYGGWGTMTIETNSRISWYFGSNGGNSSPYGGHQSSNLMSNGSWIKVTGVRDPTGYTYKWYKNGAYLSGSTYSSSYPVINTRTFTIGDGYVNPLKGKLDEFRVSQVARSAAWIAAAYKSENDEYNTFGNEEGKYVSSGTLTSQTFNAGFQADWGTLSYTTSGSGTVTVKVRSDSSSDMSGATAWGSCSGISSGNDISSNSCVTDTDQYLEYQVTLAPSGGSTPVFEDISIAFSASDIIVPPTNATSIALTGISDGAWTNTEPTITWTAGADNVGGSGILGYCIALDEATPGASSSLDPASTAGSLLNALDDGVSQSYCNFIVAGTSVDLSAISGLSLTSGKQYYFSIKAVDVAGNVWTGASGDYQDLVSFKYDGTAPSNPSYFSLPGDFISTKSATLIWPTSGGSEASDAHSGVAGLQYRIGSSGTWYGDNHNGNEDTTDLLTNDGSYSTIESPDFANISEGSNLVYLRTWDNVGNVSSTYISGALKVNTTSPSTPQSLAVTPSTSTSNSFAFSWSAPSTYTGQASNITYCYTINALPTSTNCTWTAAGVTSLSADAFANQPGENTFYLVARDEASNVNYDIYASTTFTANTSAPGIPQNIDIADVSVKATSSWKLAVSWEAPSSVGAGVQDYEIYHSTDGSSYSLESTVTGISYVDTLLTQVTHYYKVKACDSANNCGAFTEVVSLLPDGKFTTAPGLSSGPTVSSITTKKATISWGTDRTSDSKVSYGIGSGSYFTEEPSNSTQTTDHTINLTNLSPGTTYYYKAKWTDEDGNTGISSEKTFATDPAPSVKEAAAKSISISSATIEFTVSGASKVKIYYGESTDFGGLKEVSTSTNETTYTVSLEGLKDDTKYYYKINSFDSEDGEYEGDVNSFTTLPRPKISSVRLQQIRGTAQPTVLVTWNTNTAISSIVTYYPTGDVSGARDEVDVTLKTGAHRTILKGLLPNTPYSLIVKGRDKVGNEAISDTQTFTTATDTRPPQISGLKVEGNMAPSGGGSGQEQLSQLIVTWNTDEAATSQVEFGEGTGSNYSQKTQEDSNLTFNHLVVISNLSPSRVYHLRAISKDSVGNTQKSIDTVTITPKATDNALDLVITNLSEVFGFLR